MTKPRFQAVIVHAILALATVSARARIMAPKPVAPIEANGVKYSADRDGQNQYAVATDIATGKQLWKVKVFHTPIKFWIEEDVQWVFITNLRLMDTALLVRDGQARCYAVDVKTQRVRKSPCSPAFTPQEGAPPK